MHPEELDVLEANDAFYEAFRARDVARMERLWSTRQPVACLHPGWGPLLGREEVLESWRAILTGDTPEVRCHTATAHVLGDSAFVVCFEELESGQLVATNLFVREDEGWKLVHHQAGMGPNDEEPSLDGPLN